MWIKWLLIVALITMCHISPLGASELEQANKAYSRGDYAASFKLFKGLAKQGAAEVQYNLAVMYETGQGTKPNAKKAVVLYKLAADQGHAKAQYNLGNMYRMGSAVPKDAAKSVTWYRRSAQQGHIKAQFNLGLAYHFGVGVDKNPLNAYRWIGLAASRGKENARKSLYKITKGLTSEQIANIELWIADFQNLDAKSKKIGKIGKIVSAANSGSAVCLTTNGYLLTSLHVIPNCREIRLAGKIVAQVMAIAPDSDLALLKTDNNSLCKSKVMLPKNAGGALGENIIVAGYPLAKLLGGSLNVTSGLISSLVGVHGNKRFVQISAPIQIGHSGGPVLDGKGRLVGIVSHKLDAMKLANSTGSLPQNINFATKLETIKDFLNRHSVAYTTTASRSELNTMSIAEKARKTTFMITCWK
jgi:uncharacterized protein